MKEVFKKLAQHLRMRRNSITRTVTVDASYHDPTFGLQERTEDIEVVDFEALCQAIDEFAAEFDGGTDETQHRG